MKVTIIVAVLGVLISVGLWLLFKGANLDALLQITFMVTVLTAIITYVHKKVEVLWIIPRKINNERNDLKLSLQREFLQEVDPNKKKELLLQIKALSC